MKHKRFIVASILLVLVLIGSVSCSTSVNTGSPAKELSLEDQYYLGKATMGMLFEKYPYLNNEEVNDYLRLIGLTISSYTGSNDDIYTNYSFSVIDTDMLVAFAAPKGFIVLSKGLMKSCSNEDELASLVALMVSLNMTNYPIEALPCTHLKEIERAIDKEDKDLLSKAFLEAVEYVCKTLHSDYPTEEIIHSDREAIRMLSEVGYSIDSYKAILQKFSGKNLNDRFDLSIEGRLEVLEGLLEKYAPSHAIEEKRTKRFQDIISKLD